jgi:hypothetical protein
MDFSCMPEVRGYGHAFSVALNKNPCVCVCVCVLAIINDRGQSARETPNFRGQFW